MNEQSILIAKQLIKTAKEYEFIDDTGLALIEVLAEVEREFFIELLKKTDEYLARTKRNELELEEVSSLFTFVFAKSAEAVTNYINKSEQKFDFLGSFDGKIPVYVDETLMGELKKSLIPSVMASSFLDFQKDNAELNIDPKLALFESLKWTWRIGQHFSVTFLNLYLE